MTRNIDEQIRNSRTVLQDPYAYLDGDGGYEALMPERRRTNALIEISSIRGGTRGRPFSRPEIETIVRNLQNSMWRRRREIFGRDDVDHSAVLDPMLALKVVGYDVVEQESLGLYAAGKDSFEVAGVMDRDNCEVRISRRFVPTMRNFTAAHELAHAVLHEGSGLHRDRAPDGSGIGARDAQEVEADIFAAFFLLPSRLVRDAFESRFLADHFELTEATAFALTSKNSHQLRAKLRGRRDTARLLAEAHFYDSRHFKSLAERFNVSTEVMAIRLEELDLV